MYSMNVSNGALALLFLPRDHDFELPNHARSASYIVELADKEVDVAK